MIKNKIKEIFFKGDFWDLLIKWSAIIIILWFFAKAFGIIHTSFFLANLPYLMGALAVLGLGIKAGRVLEKVDNLEKNIDNIYNGIDEIRNDSNNIKDKLDDFDKRLIKLEK